MTASIICLDSRRRHPSPAPAVPIVTQKTVINRLLNEKDAALAEVKVLRMTLAARDAEIAMLRDALNPDGGDVTGWRERL